MIKDPMLAQRIKHIQDDGTPIRTFKTGGKFTIDDKFVSAEYARYLGHGAAMVYMLLCKYADKTQTAWPSIKLICRSLGYTERQVIRGIKLLEQYRLIKVYRLFGHANAYRLINSSEWLEVKPIVVKKYILKGAYDKSAGRMLKAV